MTAFSGTVVLLFLLLFFLPLCKFASALLAVVILPYLRNKESSEGFDYRLRQINIIFSRIVVQSLSYANTSFSAVVLTPARHPTERRLLCFQDFRFQRRKIYGGLSQFPRDCRIRQALLMAYVANHFANVHFFSFGRLLTTFVRHGAAFRFLMAIKLLSLYNGQKKSA